MNYRFKKILYIYLAILSSAVIPWILLLLVILVLDGPSVVPIRELIELTSPVYFVGLAIVTIFGTPAFIAVYYVCGTVLYYHLLLYGLVVGFLFGLFWDGRNLQNPSDHYYMQLLYFCIAGALTGIGFWVVLWMGKANYRSGLKK